MPSARCKSPQAIATAVRLLLLCAAACTTAAQTVTLSITFSGKPANSLSDWIADPNTIRAVINNTSKQRITAKMNTVIRKDSVPVAFTKLTDMPVLLFEPGITVLPSQNIISPETFQFTPAVQRTALRGGALPPGSYSVCVELRDAVNPVVMLSTTACLPFTLTGYEVPVLTEPQNFTTVRTQKSITFRWKPVVPQPPVPRIVRYKVLVYPVNEGQDPYHAAQTAVPLLEKWSDSKDPLVLYWQIPKATMVSGARYVWTVQASDANGDLYGEPDGLAEPFIFTIE
ncbi:MAG: hypothetical protein JNL32_05775 [Candidatus Kapabacteria bacterium]|nr:hypothetical protein [Candidatus Kapabacteria bacterium]